MRLIAWWIGTDALTLIKNPPGNKLWHFKLFFYRFKWKLLKGFFTHWCVHENLNYYLKKFGINAEVRVWPADYPDKIEKKPHKNFNILYYHPAPANLGGQKYSDWYYGYEIIKKIQDHFYENEDINFIKADLTYEDIDDLYAVTDIYIRPNSWDGHPRMTQECEIKGIPFYWESSMSNEGFLKANYEDCLKKIEDVYRTWKARI